MKSKKLLMVTMSFPYGRGESFVEAEVAHLSRYFDEIELVPCFQPTDVEPRQVPHKVNLEYSNKRWGAFRKLYLISSFGRALWNYDWFSDLAHIVGQPHKLENIKELVRSLYRAQLFETFLETQVLKNKKEYGLIYFYWVVPEIMGAIGLRRKTGRDLKIVARAHGGDLYEERRAGGYAGLRNSVLAGIDDIYCISDHGKSYLTGRYPSLARKFHTARLGVNDPGSLNVLPAEGQLAIVSCSFMVAGKRLHLIIEAIKYLLDRDPALKIKWTHIGDGELYDQLSAAVVEKLAQRAEVVFKGYLTRNQVMDLYRDESFDVIVNVSDCEGIPVSLMEASSAGIPMIATDVGGSSEIVNAANGVLIPADADVASIAAALGRFADKEFGRAHRKRSRSYWDERFNAENNYNRFGQELMMLLEPHATASTLN